MDKSSDYIKLEAAYREIQIQLEEANDIIDAIRSGEVDALVVNGKDGHQLFTLKSADHSYRIFIEQMIESALTLNRDGIISYCNSQFAALCQSPLERLIGKDFLDFIEPGYKDLAKEVITQAWQKETKAELLLKNSSGNNTPVQLSLKQLDLDESISLSVIITDLTDIKKTQQLLQIKNAELEEAQRLGEELNENLERIVRDRTAELEAKNQELFNALKDLRESEDNLHSAFNAGELGSCSLDLKTGRAEMSERFRELYGLPVSGEISWEMVLSAVDPAYIPGLNKVLENCIIYGSPVDSTYPIKHLLTGEKRWMRVVGKCKKDESGNFVSVYAVLMDVTDQKLDEQRKNDFIAMVSHELKTPLTSVKGYIQVLQLKAKIEKLAFPMKALEGANRQIVKMTNMINGFLNVARLESGKIMIDFEKVELNKLVQEILEEYKGNIVDHRFQENYGPELFIMADWEKLGQVINNLISNAIKYSSGNTEISISCFQDGSNAVFKVIDQGMGISTTDLPRLFERFYRVENSKTATVAGFGIGLYLSSEIIQRHQGRIWAESELGESSTFYFSIPLALGK